jgi:hypothetical protein
MSGWATPSYGDDDGGEGLRHFHVEDGTNAFGSLGHVSFPKREASARVTDSGDERRPTDSARQNSQMRVQTAQAAIIARENVILAGFRKRKSFEWALHPM